MKTFISRATLALLITVHANLKAQIPAPQPPQINNFVFGNGLTSFDWTPFPAADSYVISATSDLNLAMAPDANGSRTGFTWTSTNTSDVQFFRLDTIPLDTNAQLTASVLNRLAYGPTPHLLDRFSSNSISDFITEQLAPETVVENSTLAHTNVSILQGKFADHNTYMQLEAETGPGSARLKDLRAWHLLNAVHVDRQLLEVLTQFLENHFVTQFTKSRAEIGKFFQESQMEERMAVSFEYREIDLWRQALLSPACTFRQLLEISCESPAMILYLDTFGSRADKTRIPNENFSREIMELFCMGVDNGYDQTDIEQMSFGWAGWTLEMVELGEAFNPFAPRATTELNPGLGTSYTNLVGVCAFNFRSEWHDEDAQVIFSNKFVPARFGKPWVSGLYGNATPGLYQLDLPIRTGTNAVQDGYDIINHVADLPFTQEFISVKLCRLFVHDNFAHGYDFTSPTLSPEGQLVKQCMLVWETNSPKGQIRKVLRTIFDSELFQSQNAAFAKIKTPIEYAASAIRALALSTNRTRLANTFTADTDGYSLIVPMSRMGSMLLFDRSDPDGYPEHGQGWISAGTLAERVRWVQSFCIAEGLSGHSGNQNGTKNDALFTVCDPVRLLQTRLPSPGDQLDATKVANLFLGFLYPGEGAANLEFYRQAAVNYLNTEDDGVTPSNFNLLISSNSPGTAYDTRIRGLVAMLMSAKRFNEQ